MAESIKEIAALFAIAVLLLITSCGSRADATNSTAAIPELPARPEPIEMGSGIRQIDFANFCYSGPLGYDLNFCLRNGEKPYVHHKEDGIYLVDVKYHDLTSDGQEEAIVKLDVQTGGSAIPHFVFIFSLDNSGRAVTLWSFTSGDRAEGGLKSVAPEMEICSLSFMAKTNLRMANGHTCRARK